MNIKALIRRLIGDRRREPARLITRGASLVTGVVGLAALWGLDISDAKQTAILATMSTVIPVLVTVGECIRPLVASSETVATAVAAAKAEPVNSTVVPDVALPGYQEQVTSALKDEVAVPDRLRFRPTG